jgi:hypothetical protein
VAEKKIVLIPIDVYEDGDLVRIEFNKSDGEFVFQTVWDENDEQTSENRVLFRKWSYRIARQLDDESYDVAM